MIGEKEQRKRETAVDKEKRGWVREPGSVHLVKKRAEAPIWEGPPLWMGHSGFYQPRECQQQSGGVPCTQNTAWGQPVSTATLGGRLGARPARRALTPYCTSKSREETDRRLAENIMKGGLGRAVKKSLGQMGKQRYSKRSRIGSVFTFYHAQWATSSCGGLASVHLGDGCQSTVVGALGSVTPPAARGLRSTSEWPPCPPPHWISSETESQTS